MGLYGGDASVPELNPFSVEIAVAKSKNGIVK
jgi:hypothetical protein